MLIQQNKNCTVQEATELALSWVYSEASKWPEAIYSEIHRAYPSPVSRKIKIHHSTDFDHLMKLISGEPLFQHDLGKNDAARKVRTAIVLYAKYGLANAHQSQLSFTF